MNMLNKFLKKIFQDEYQLCSENYLIDNYICKSEKFNIYNKYKTKWAKEYPSCDCEMCVNNSDERIIGYYFICG